jgi:curved DNA-binding protein CbpA
MSTLYELLGALSHDDAEELRTAFRKAVKGAHPDLRPDDPDAALKFREIVRANEILCDPEQRQAYDHLLELARLESKAASPQPPIVKIRKFASAAAMACAGVSAMVVGIYLLFMQVSSSGAVTSANNVESGITETLVAASADFDTTPLPINAAPRTSTTQPSQHDPNLDLIVNGEEVESMRARQFNRDGDFTMAHLNPALQPTVIFYQLKKFDGAFSLLPTKSIQKSESLKSAPKIARRKSRLDQSSLMPLRFSIFQARTVGREPSREKRVAQIR